MLKFSTDRTSSMQYTFGGVGFNTFYQDVSVGGDGYLVRGSIGNERGFDTFGGSGGFFSTTRTTSGYMNNDLSTVIDLGVAEVGVEGNYSPVKIVKDIVEGFKNYFNEMFETVVKR